MQADNRWAQPVVSDLAAVPIENNHSKRDIEQRLSVHSPPLSVLPPPGLSASSSNGPNILFPPQRVEPIEMARSHQQTASNRHKMGYMQSATTDEFLPTASYMQNRPIARLKHATERSSFLIFLSNVSKASLTLILSLPCVLVISLILPICWLIRMILRSICRYRCPVRPCSCSYLSATDLFWFYSDLNSSVQEKQDETAKFSSSTVPPTAAAIFFLEGAINENSLKKLLINRLISNSTRRSGQVGRKLFPRFSQIIISRFSGTMWIDYSAFSIDEHVQEIPRDIQSDEDLQSFVSTLTSTELNRSRPLWQLHFKNRSLARTPESVLVFVYHPALSDGISLLRILLRHVVDNRTTQLDIKPRFVGRHNERALDYIRAYFFGHFLIFRRLFFRSSLENFFKRNQSKTHEQNHVATIDSRPQHRQRRVVVWSDPYSLSQANRMKLVTRTRMNDLLSTLVISTVRLYMERHGISHPPDMTCIVPCDLRSNTSNIVMGNHVSHLCFDLPMNIEGNIPILWSFNDNMKRMKEQGDYATMHLFTNITYLLFPLYIANKIIARVYNHASLWLTTLGAGTSTALATMSVCNRDVRSFICLSPSVGTASISFCVTSYADEIRLAVVADPNIVPDPQFFAESFLQQMNTVYDLLAHRRIPGEIRRIIRPPRIQPPKKSISSISDMSDDLTIEEIQAKMTALQQELLSLKSQFENADADDPSSQTQRLMITAKLEELRREFRDLLIKLQERQCEMSGMIPSDEEDEMDPNVRVRLRSSSVASRISLRSSDQRLFSAKAYQLEKEEGSEFTATIFRGAPSSSKSSLTVQPMTEQHDSLRRAQSVGLYENSTSDEHLRKSVDRTRPTTPSHSLTTATNTTVIHLDPNENWKHTTGI